MFKNKYIKHFSPLFLAILVLHISMVTISSGWDCDCDRHRERMTGCCNCPKCVDERGGLLSYCRLRNNPYPNDKDKDPSLRSSKCVCGLGNVVFYHPDEVYFLTVQHSDHFPFPPLYFVKIEPQILDLDDFILPHDNPG